MPSSRRKPGRDSPKSRSVALHIAAQLGLTAGPKTRHLNAKVPPRLYAAAARRAGSTSPAVVLTAALAALATEDELGPWLVRQWGTLADLDPTLLAELDL